MATDSVPTLEDLETALGSLDGKRILVRTGDGTACWTSPLGRSYTVRPPPLLPRR